MSLLKNIKSPNDLKTLDIEDLEILCKELTDEVINIVAKNGGHLGANLGVVELSVALHKVFSAPKDKIVFDVSHQTYVHKLLTGRQELMQNLRQEGGASGFMRIAESIYDPFGAGHASTGASASFGMAVARDIKNENNHVLAIVGDGAMSGGMTFEALNNIGHSKSKITIILNDNGMSIAPAVGAFSNYFSKITSSPIMNKVRDLGVEIAKKLPNPTTEILKKTEELLRNRGIGASTLFEEMGFYYVGPVDGHNLSALIEVLENIKNLNKPKPILLHVVTQKGKGYEHAENAKDKGHGVSKFNKENGESVTKKTEATYTDIFSKTFLEIASKDNTVASITAAMPDSVGLTKFAELYENRFFDVGIAEEHAVTFAAGLASCGIKPFVAIYSTFMQRAIDQVIHDVDIQNLPVRFMLDRAGYVGDDGATHAGAYDLSFFGTTENIVVMAPSSMQELEKMVNLSYEINDKPSMVRYPRGNAFDENKYIKNDVKLERGKGRIINQGKDFAILSIGTRLEDVIVASEELKEQGINVTIADARFLKPLDTELINELVKNHKAIITVEEGIIGGLSSHVMDYLAKSGIFDNGIIFRSLKMPCEHFEHSNIKVQQQKAKIDKKAIIETVLNLKNKYL